MLLDRSLWSRLIPLPSRDFKERSNRRCPEGLMHELSIALSIVEAAEEEAEKRQARVCAVYLRLGRLSGVVKDALLASYELAASGTSLEGSRLVIEEVPIVAYCARCNARRAVAAPEWFLCSECRLPISEILEGKELEVRALEIAE